MIVATTIFTCCVALNCSIWWSDGVRVQPQAASLSRYWDGDVGWLCAVRRIAVI